VNVDRNVSVICASVIPLRCSFSCELSLPTVKRNLSCIRDDDMGLLGSILYRRYS
jgi:hypothetical protein